MRINVCKFCEKSLSGRSQKKYCSNKCQSDFIFREYINNWKLGIKDGSRGLKAKNTSSHLRRYLLSKYKQKCSKCGWSFKNEFTNKLPLEIHHVDGNADNNNEKNLEILCPNCHSLTRSFRNLNRGRGRPWR